MNYSYLYINKLIGEDRLDLFDQLKKSVEILNLVEKDYGSISLFIEPGDADVKDFSKKNGIFNREISLSRNYSKDGNISLIDILVEKIIQLKNFNQEQDTVLLDIDTVFKSSIPMNFWEDDRAVFWSAEYYITQFRNLDKVLPYIPWEEIDIKFTNDFIMYNTGVVYIPKKHRKEICEKALWITDYLNNGQFLPNDRFGNKLDEQIGLSIAVHDHYGKYGKIKTCEQYIHHYWDEKARGIKWWKNPKVEETNKVKSLPISAGIISWNSKESLKNTLNSYRKNGLFDIVDDFTILFQEASEEDKKLAQEFNIPYIALENNIGIGRGFIELCKNAKHPHILLLEHDWELTVDYETTRLRLESALEMLEDDTDVVRLRNRLNPGVPLFSYYACNGRELEHLDPIINLPGAHLHECVHWIENPDLKFPEHIFAEKGHYVTTSRYSNWTNNPCLYRTEFYIKTVSQFVNTGGLLLEPDISNWWARQNFKVSWGEGLFTHNDIDKYGKNS